MLLCYETQSLVFSDTAGLRDIDDPVEQEGVRRALHRQVI